VHHFQPTGATPGLAIALYPLCLLQRALLLSIKEKQAHGKARTGIINAHQQATAASKLHPTAFNRAQYQGMLAVPELINRRYPGTIFKPYRQVKQQIKGIMQAQPCQLFSQRSTDTVQCRQRLCGCCAN